MAIRRCTERGGHNGHGPCTSYDDTYAGRVLDTYERNGYHDSDFYAIVWDDDRGIITSVEYATTRFWTYHNHATVDASPEAIAAAERYLADQLYGYYRSRFYEIEKGKTVKSLATRGQAVGAVGTVEWIGERRSRYGSWSYGYRVGIKVEGETKLRFVNADKVRVVGEPTSEDLAGYREQADRVATQHAWRTLEGMALAYAMSA